MDREQMTATYDVERFDALDAIVGRKDTGGRLSAVAFIGKQSKPAWWYAFKTAEQREQHIAKFIESRKAILQYKAERKAEQCAAPRAFALGDIAKTSWGYDQTNVDFFEVVALVGAKSVAIRKIAQKRTENSFMAGTCIPVPGAYLSAPVTKLTRGDTIISADEYRNNAYKYEGRPVYWSAYA